MTRSILDAPLARRLRPLAAAALLLAACAAHAQAPQWDELEPEQQEVLRGLKNDWNELSDERRDRLLLGTQRWLQMTPEEREKAQSRLQRWNNLDPDRKQRLQRLREEFRSMSPAERDALLSRYREFKELPEDERKRIRERFRELRARPGGLESECGVGGIGSKMDCLGIPQSRMEGNRMDRSRAGPGARRRDR